MNTDAPPIRSLEPEEPHRLRPDVMARLDFGSIFGGSHPVELELGSGDGSFLAQYAALHPERSFLGVERLLGRLRKLGRKADRAGLTNLRSLRLEASYVLEWMIPPRSLAALHVYFPDPWPKRRHWKRRLINSEFVRHAATALKPGGVVYLRTDNAPYFEQMVEVFGASTEFAVTETPAELAAVVTDFERDFNASGIPTLRAAYRVQTTVALANDPPTSAS